MKLVVTEFITLDGVTESPHEWSFPYWNDEISAFKNAELEATGAMLLGRVTYDGFAAAWPGRAGDPFADKFNALKKYAVSKTLTNPSWQNTSVLAENVVAEIEKLRKQPGGNLVVHGSMTLVKTLMENDLVDEYDLLIYPIVLGKGLRLFKDEVGAKLELKETQRYGEVVLATFEPAR